MKRNVVVLGAVAALLVSAGCHRKSSDSNDFHPQFSTSLAAGSTGDIMNKSAQQYGIPIYPGATPDTTRYTAGNTTGRTFLTYTTGDSADKVTEFYASTLNLKPVTSGNVSSLVGTTPSGSQVTINVGKNMETAKTIFTVLAVLRPPAVQNTAPPATTVSTAPTPVTAPAPTQTAPDTSSPNWNANTGGAPQTSGDNSDNSQNQIPPPQTDNNNGYNNNGQGQDQQGQTGGDNSGNDNDNGQQAPNAGPPGGG